MDGPREHMLHELWPNLCFDGELRTDGNNTSFLSTLSLTRLRATCISITTHDYLLEGIATYHPLLGRALALRVLVTLLPLQLTSADI